MAAITPHTTMSADALDAASRSTTVLQRMTDVNNIVDNMALPVDHKDPVCVVKAFEILQISTHNLTILRIEDPYERRKLFGAASIALNCIAQCAFERTGVPRTSVDLASVDDLERKIWARVPLEKIIVANSYVIDRSACLGDRYEAMVTIPDLYNSNLAEMQSVVRLALGEAVDLTEEAWLSGQINSPLLGSPYFVGLHLDSLGQADRDAYSNRMLEIALRTVILMAAAISKNFGGQAVHVLGMMIPVYAFD